MACAPLAHLSLAFAAFALPLASTAVAAVCAVLGNQFIEAAVEILRTRGRTQTQTAAHAQIGTMIKPRPPGQKSSLATHVTASRMS
jgi:hypothetical protein